MYRIFYNTAVGNLIIVCAGSIPGYWVTVALVDTVGRKPIQFMGFALLTIIFAVIGFAYDKLVMKSGALLALYVLAQFFFNFGTSLHPSLPPISHLPSSSPLSPLSLPHQRGRN